MPNVGSLLIDISANLAHLRKDMAEAQRTVSGSMEKIQASVATAKKAIAGLAIGFATTKLIGHIQSTIDAADETSKLAQKLGITTEQLSVLQHGADMSGLSIEGLSAGLRKLAQNLVEAKGGSTEAGAAFEAMKLDPKQFTDVNQALAPIADRFASYADGANKTALAIKLFGKAGAELIPLLNGGAEGLKAVADEAERLGLVLSTEAGKQAEQFNDDMSRLQATASQLERELAKGLLPGLTDISKAMVEAAREGGILQAIWVGLGGIGAKLFLGDEMQQAAKRLQDLQQRRDDLLGGLEMAKQTQQRAAQGGVGGLIARWLGADPEKIKQELESVNQEMFATEKHIYELQQPQGPAPQTPPEPPKPQAPQLPGRPERAARVGKTDEERAAEAIQKELDALRDQLATLPLNEKQQELYKLATMGATKAQLEQASAMGDAIEALKNAIDEEKEYNQVIAEGVRLQIEQAGHGIETLDNIRQETALMKLSNDEREIQQRLLSTGLQPWDASYKAVEAALREQQALAKSISLAHDLGDAFSSAFEQAILGGKSLRDVLGGLASDLASILTRKLVTEPLANFISSGLVSFGGFRAGGGPVSAGRSYLVGERHAELFIPSTSGRIESNVAAAPSSANIRIVNAFDHQVIGDYLGSQAGEQLVMNVVRRNQSAIRAITAGGR